MMDMILFLVIFTTSVVSTLIMARVFRLERRQALDREKLSSILDKVIILTSAVLFTISLLWDYNFLKFSHPIKHQDWEKITLSDFKGMNRPFHSLEGSTEFAFILSTIEVHKEHGGFRVETLFHPCRSYVYNRRIFAPALLTHEMVHFHITELHARMLRKELSESSGRIDLKAKLKRILDAEQAMQERYDYESYHGQLSGKQLGWEAKTKAMLDSLSSFENPLVLLVEN